jgi:hypothetical protein
MEVSLEDGLPPALKRSASAVARNSLLFNVPSSSDDLGHSATSQASRAMRMPSNSGSILYAALPEPAQRKRLAVSPSIPGG